MKRMIVAMMLIVSIVMLVACHAKKNNNPNLVIVGTIAGPETQLMEVAKTVALQKFGLHVKIVTFSDYSMPNQALEDGDIDANAFQHYPFLLSQIKIHGYAFTPVGNTFLYPMGLYSNTVKKLADLKAGAKIAIPNDPSNEARALLLLEKAGLITLKPSVMITATTQDILKNPHHYQIVTMDAAQLPRVLEDVGLAAINTNYAIPAGLKPSVNALLAENAHSPYMNLIVARTTDKNELKIKELVEAYQSQPVIAEAQKLFGNEAIAGFK